MSFLFFAYRFTLNVFVLEVLEKFFFTLKKSSKVPNKKYRLMYIKTYFRCTSNDTLDIHQSAT